MEPTTHFGQLCVVNVNKARDIYTLGRFLMLCLLGMQYELLDLMQGLLGRQYEFLDIGLQAYIIGLTLLALATNNHLKDP